MTEAPDWVKRKIDRHEEQIRLLEAGHAVTRRDIEMLTGEIGSLRTQIAEGRGEAVERHAALMDKLECMSRELSEQRGARKMGVWLAGTLIGVLALGASWLAIIKGAA